MLHFIKKPKIQNGRVQGFMYSYTTEKWYLKLVLFTSSTYIDRD